MRSRTAATCLAVLASITAVLTLGACGKNKNNEAQTLAFSISESGKKATFQLPSEKANGGLTKVELTNNGKQPHSAQLILVQGSHSSQEVNKAVSSDSKKIPSWLRGEGGASSTAPGQTSTSTINLPAGHYVVRDDVPEKNNAQAETDVGNRSSGDLPSTDASITAANPAKDKYQWQISGLKSGENTFHFVSKGKEALHHVVIAPIKPDQTTASIKKALSAQNGPPPFDFRKAQLTSVLDGGRDEVTSVNLKPGKYVFLCFLNDRDGGKPHFEEGLLTTQTIK